LSAQIPSWPPTAEDLRAVFDAVPPYTIGLEDEVMLLGPEDFELVARATEVLALLDGDPRFKLEMPASQIEIVTPASPSLEEAVASLREGRRRLAERTSRLVRLATAGVHPSSPGIGELNRLERYERTIREYGVRARRQLVCALQVHVSVGDANGALAVYNAARSYLPLLAALAANAPFYQGHDTGLASVRPKLAQLLPRQGVPPEIESWEAYAEAFRWGASSGAFDDPRRWWWELRLHPGFGTLEFRVPDAQSTVDDAAAVAATVQALVVWLAERHSGGEPLAVAPTWKIEENSWLACRDGVRGQMADLQSGTVKPTSVLLADLLATLQPIAARLGSERALERAGRMLEGGGADAQRRVARKAGVRAVARWLSERFLE
jgi:glutamate---cysteine ligase / carboxylate-amine ligase